MDVPPITSDLPHALPIGDRTYLVDRATRGDVAAVVALLRDDELGTARESATDHDLRPYRDAFDEIDIGPVEAARFARTQAGTGQQSDEDRQHRASLGAFW